MLIGLTGGIGSGKSTVASMFIKYGLPVVDADVIAKRVVEPDEMAWNEIIAYFGEDILLPDRTINRKKLGRIIFNDREKREKLNEITHPIIISTILAEAKSLEKNNQIVVVDIPLLFESNREKIFKYIVVVYVSHSTQIERLMARDNISKKEAEQKISTQMSLEEKKAKADFVINNEKGLDLTEAQVRNLIKKFI